MVRLKILFRILLGVMAFASINDACLAAESSSEASVKAEQKFKEMLKLENYESLAYKNAAGVTITAAEFMELVATKKPFSTFKNPEKHQVVLAILNEEEQKRKSEPRSLSIPIHGAMPGVALVDTQGVSHKWGSLKGKPILLGFFFAECAPCISEVPILNEFAKRNPNIRVLAVTFDETAIAKQFVAKYGLKWPVVPDAQKFIDQIGVPTYPTMILVSADGHLLGFQTGRSNPLDDKSPDDKLKAERVALERWVEEKLK